MPQQPTNQNKLITWLIILGGAALGYFYHTNLAVQPTIEQLPAAGTADLEKLKTLKIDFKLLDKDQYKALQVYGEVPVNVGAKGKPDPFAP
jgi:hypothetical protein